MPRGTGKSWPVDPGADLGFWKSRPADLGASRGKFGQLTQGGGGWVEKVDQLTRVWTGTYSQSRPVDPGGLEVSPSTDLEILGRSTHRETWISKDRLVDPEGGGSAS